MTEFSKNNIYYSYTENYFDGTNSSGIDAKISEEMNALYTKYDDKTWQYYVMDDMYNIISNYYYNDQDENITKVYNEAKEAISKDLISALKAIDSLIFRLSLVW